MRLPARLHINHVTVNVQPCVDPTLDGLADFDEGTISIRQRRNKQEEAQTLLHEAFHFLLYHSGITETKAIHASIDVLSSGMLAMMQDNQEFRKYIMSVTRERK